MHAILVPRESVNADSVYVVRWLQPDGVEVTAGVAVCEVETSKAVFTVEAAHAGILHHRASRGQEVPVGGVLGYIGAAGDVPPAVEPSPERERAEEVRFSARARVLIDELGLDPALFAGRGLVRERDVREVASARQMQPDARGTYRVESLGVIQRRVARAMEASLTVPVSYVERVVDFGAVQERVRALMQELRIMLTPIDLLVASVARAAGRHPRFNASPAGPETLHVYEGVNVGLAIDIDRDLYVVVLHDAAAKPLAELAKQLRVLQYQAQRRQLGLDALTGGTITVASMVGRGIHHFHPLPYPEQTAVVGLADPVGPSAGATLVLGFDHRVANGGDAATFLGAVADGLMTVR